MSLNIKSEEAHRLAQELVGLTGETMTAAVTEALRRRLYEVSRPQEGVSSERLLAIGRDTAPRLKEPYRSIDHADLLYGDDGLPR